MRRFWIVSLLITATFLFGCRFFFVTAPESTNPSRDIEIIIDLMPDSGMSDGSVYAPVVCLGKPASWTISEVSYSGMTNSTVQAFGFPSFSLSNSTYMDSTYSLTYASESGSWSCYIGQETSWTSDAKGSVTFEAVTGPAGAFTIYVSAGVDDPYGPDWSMIEKRIAVVENLGDLEHWIKGNVDIEADSYLYGIAQGGGNYVAVGRKLAPSYPSGWAPLILHSTDGMNWTEVLSAGSQWLEEVHYADGRFVAVGELGLVITSTTGESWAEVNPAGSSWLENVAYGNGTWVAVGNNEALWATDINSWSSTVVPGAFDLHGVTYAEGLFVAVGGWTSAKANIFTSPDGQDWTLVENSVNGTLYDIAYGNGRFVAVGDSHLYYSDDLATWNLLARFANGPLYGVAWSGGKFVTVGVDGEMYTSPDGAVWTQVASGTSLKLEDVAADGKRFIAVGDSGLIILSNSPSGGGGGGGGGCNTAGPAPGDPLWPEMVWIAMMGGIFLFHRGMIKR